VTNELPAENFTERVQRAERFFIYFANGDRAYQNHKENMAYAGTALLITAFGSALLSENWPPVWTQYPVLQFSLPVVSLVVVWTFFLSYVRFQLTNRRWIAIRLAATEHVLASWASQRPPAEALEPVRLTEQGTADSLLRSVFWPSMSMPIKLAVVPETFPKAFADALADKAKRGSLAVIHERILFLFTWFMFVALLMKTVVVLNAIVCSGLTPG